MRKGNTDMKTQVDSMNEEFGVGATSAASAASNTGDESKSGAGNDLTDLAQYAFYRDENDPNRLKLVKALREDPINTTVDNPDYRDVNGRNKDWYVNWEEGSRKCPEGETLLLQIRRRKF